MKKTTFLILSLLTLCCSYTIAQTTIASQSFELETPGDQYANAATDGNSLALNAIVNIGNQEGQSPVDATAASAGTLGFDASWQNTRMDVGLSDGDFVGVTAFTGDVGSFPDGTQGYQFNDPDGRLILTMETVDISTFTNVVVSLDYFINSTGWEADDEIIIVANTDQGTFTILDTSGSDIDDLGIEGSFTTGSVTIPDTASTVQLVISSDSNSGVENLYIDNIVVSGDPEVGTGSPALIISEIVDATLPGGLPKFVELTNVGTEVIDLSQYSIGNFSNGGTTLGGGASTLLSGNLAPGDSYVISYENGDSPGSGAFFDTYGFDPDNFDLGSFINGDDVVALFLGLATGDGTDATLVDVYGIIGTDGTGQPWEYTDGYAYRNTGVIAPNSTFTLSEWIVGGANSLETGDDATELPLILANTTPGVPGGPVTDTTAPVITLVGDNPLELAEGDTFTDPGATALDNVDGDITGNIVVGGDTVDTNTPGSYVITYNVMDTAGNAAVEMTRTVNVSLALMPSVVINEIMYNPVESGTDTTEYIELFNNSGFDVDLGGWTFFQGVDFTFPTNTILADQEYLVITVNASGFQSEYGFAADFEWTSGALSNSGETIELQDASGVTQDIVSYDDAAPWPTEPDGTGPSLELRDPGLDNGLAASWSASVSNNGTPGTLNGETSNPPNLVINELRISSGGDSDDASNFVELFGAPSTALDGLTIVVVSGEFAPGRVDFAFDLTGTSTDANGFFLVANADIATAISQVELDPTDLTADFDFFGSPVTFLLVQDFTGNQGDDLDEDNDGTFDNAIGTIIDSVSLVDGDDTPDVSYSMLILGPSGNFPPAGLFRDVDGTGTFMELVFGDFSVDTPGFTNVSDNGGGPAVDVLISEIQGNNSNQQSNIPGSGAHDDRSPLEGQSVTIQGIVTGVYPDLDGFFMQEEDTDNDPDPTTSEGIFIFVGSDPTVGVGNLVSVTGAVDEFFGMTQIDNDNGDFAVVIENSGNNLNLVSATAIDLPVPAGDFDDFYEQYEGMVVNFTDDLFVSEYFQLARFGQVILTEGGRPFQYTHGDDTPTAGEFVNFQDALRRRQIIVDDGNNIQNEPLPDGVLFHPQPNGFGVGTQGTHFFRGGDKVSNLTGILHWSFAGFTGTDAWRIRPVDAAPTSFTATNTRPALPEDVGGNIKVAAFNVLNYFTTLDEGSNVTFTGLEPRGAHSTDELTRQTDKLVEALAAIDADIFGLVELENDDDNSTVKAVIDALNTKVGSGTYNFIATGVTGTDAIKQALIYKPAVVSPIGAVAVLTDAAFADPNGTGQQRNRPAIAQTFEVTDTNNPDLGAIFTVAVNHFKSKGDSGLDDGPCNNPASNADCDQGDGQGFWNDTRTKAAQALADWLASDPTSSGDADVIILGDLNAYKGETPIAALKNAGYADLIENLLGNNAYSFVFDSQLGYLDYAMTNEAMTPQVTGITEWHINADEVNVFDYNNTVQDGNEQSFEAKPTGNTLFEVNAFRTSDHDPVIVGIDLSIPDTIPPIITLLGENPLILTLGEPFEDPGATALDDVDGEIDPSTIVVGGDIVNVDVIGTYLITYNVTDAAGNAAEELTRIVMVEEPELTVTRFVLVDANSNQDIMELVNGTIIDLNTLASRRLNIRAETTSDTKSVRFVLTGALRQNKVENLRPFALFGDLNGNYAGRKFVPGEYHLRAIPFSKKRLGGDRGNSLEVDFSVINSGISPSDIIKTIKIAPNPARSFTKISFDAPLDVEQIRLFNLFGRLVRVYDGNDVRQGDFYVLNLRNLRSGLYFVRVQDFEGNKVQSRLLKR